MNALKLFSHIVAVIIVLGWAGTANAFFNFTYGSDFVEFSDLSSNAEALKVADAVQRGDSVIDNQGVIIINGEITINGLSAARRATVIQLLTHVSSVTVNSYVRSDGVLRYRVRVRTETNALNVLKSVSITPSRGVVVPGENFSLFWSQVGFTNPNCTLDASGPTAVTIPKGSSLHKNGSTTLSLRTVGDYRFSYVCTEGSERREAWQTIKVSSSGENIGVQISGAHCFISPEQSSCKTALNWDYRIDNGTIQSAVVTNVTTQTIVSTDARGILRPIDLYHGTNTISFTINAIDKNGQVKQAKGTIQAVAVCSTGTVWNGSICVSDTASDYWGIIGDFNSYGRSYAGMPAYHNGNTQHPSNIMCRKVNLWACDVRDDQPPVMLEFFIDDKLVLTDRPNVPAPGLVDPWWEGSGRYRRTPGCGDNDHHLTFYNYYIPNYLKDNKVHILKVKATRSDGLQKWMTFNGWNGHYDYGYPNSIYQSFPFQCAPQVPSSALDLAGYLSFPAEIAINTPQSITEARVLNAGLTHLSSSTKVAIQFDFNRDNPSGAGGPNDFTIWTTVNNIAAGQTVYPLFLPVTVKKTGNWRTRILVDPQNEVEPWSSAPTSTRRNNISKWSDFVAISDDGLPRATLNPGSCVIPAGFGNCEVSVRWSSYNFIGATELLQGGSLISKNQAGSGLRRRVSPTDKKFTVKDTGGNYSLSASADVRCADLGVWDDVRKLCLDSTTSLPPPEIAISSPQIVRYGKTASIEIEIRSSYNVSCTVQGLGRTSETFVHTQGNSTHVFTTNPLYGKQTVSVTCDETSKSSEIEVVPLQQEV